jgi:hypothetical protein
MHVGLWYLYFREMHITLRTYISLKGNIMIAVELILMIRTYLCK